MPFDKHWQEAIYSQGLHLNAYPYGNLVSYFFHALSCLKTTSLTDKKKIKILELGCGSGNNLWFLSEQGFDVYGVEGSSSACEHARSLCKKRGVDVKIVNATFDSLPFEDQYFDIIIDREATYCGTLNDMKNWWSEADRTLKKGGIVLSFLFNDSHPELQYILDKKRSATKLEERTYCDLSEGAFAATGTVHFSTFEELQVLFDFCIIERIDKNGCTTVYHQNLIPHEYSEWILIGVKK